MTTKTKVYPAKRDPKAVPMHPGALLKSVLPAMGRPKAEIADLLGISRNYLYDLTGQKFAVTAEMALRLGKLCGNGPDLWLSLQTAYDLHQARQAIGKEVDKIPTLNVAVGVEPL